MRLSEWIEQNSDREIADIETLEKCLKKEPKTVWELEDLQEYYFINVRGDIENQYWENHRYDLSVRNIGNAFLTYEEAAREAKRREIEALLLKYGGRREYKTNEVNACIAYSTDMQGVVASFVLIPDGSIYFNSKEDAFKAIEAIGEQRIIDAYFKPYILGQASNKDSK